MLKLIPRTVSNSRIFTILNTLINLPDQIVLRLIQPTRVVKVIIVLMMFRPGKTAVLCALLLATVLSGTGTMKMQGDTPSSVLP